MGKERIVKDTLFFDTDKSYWSYEKNKIRKNLTKGKKLYVKIIEDYEK
ncbi:hypothetical protein [Oceanobacillus sp. CF4.6]